MADSQLGYTPGTGATVDTRTTAAGEHREVVVLGGDGDLVAGVTAWGHQRVSLEPMGLFYDAFAALDTTDRWTVAGTAPVVAANTLTPVATASTYSGLISKPVFPIGSSQYLQANFAVDLEAAAGTGAARFFGFGTAANTPGVDSLVQDGVGFEVRASDGSLQAVTYKGGARTVIATLSRPADGAFHRYSVAYRQTQTFWFIDGQTVVAAQAMFLDLTTTDFPLAITRFNAASQTGTPLFVFQAAGLSDTSRFATQLADAAFPWRKQVVDASGAARTALAGNLDAVTVRASAAQAAAATIQSAALTNPGAKGVVITVNVSAVSGTGPSLTTQVQYLDPVSGTYVALAAANTAQTAAGAATIVVYPGVATASPGTGSAAVSAVLPKTWRLQHVVTGTLPSVTFSVGAQYIV